MSKPRFVTLPADVRSVQIATPSGPLAALRSAEVSPAPRGTAVLVPGYTGSKEDFIAVVGPLTKAGFDVVAIDQRGQHDSPGAAPDDAADAYTLPRLGQEILDLLDAVSPDEPVHLLGHSYGGLVVREAAIRNPSRIRTLTLLCSGPAAIPDPSGENARLLAAAVEIMPLPDIWAELRRMSAAAGEPDDPEDIAEFLRRRFLNNDPAQLIGNAREITTAADRVAELKGTGLPIFVACGATDDAWPVEVQREMAGRLGAPFHLIADAGHSPAVDNPEGTVAYLDGVWAG